MTRRNTPLEVEQVEQLALIARLLPHHGESPSLISQADGITFRQFSRALFQQHRPLSDIRENGGRGDAGGQFAIRGFPPKSLFMNLSSCS